MKFYSNKNKSHLVSFEEALLRGIAPDKGLYMPQSIPQFSRYELHALKGKSLQDIAFAFLNKWLSEDIDESALKKIIKKALNFPIPIKKVGTRYILEVFYGPTMSFKDVGARFLAQYMEFLLKKRNKRITLLVATSGDTGGAVAQGFVDLKSVKVVVLYPKNKISGLQKTQLTHVADNVIPVEVDGSFDDCQSLVKRAFVDKDLRGLNLTSANSINVGRLLPQALYYLYAYTQINAKNVEFVVPSGNMGNLTAGFLLYKMGVPIRFIAATNANNSVAKYYKTGKFVPSKAKKTLSNSMDVGSPSNFVRILELCNFNVNNFREVIRVVDINDKETIQIIKKVYMEHGYLFDPHTAVAWAASEKKISKYDKKTIIISTASPLKFAEEIFLSTGIKVDPNGAFISLKTLKERKISMKKDYHHFKKLLLRKNFDL